MSEQPIRQGCCVYGIARKQRECYGHGEFGDELAIRRQYTRIPGQPYAEGFPPLFLTEREALDWIKAQRYTFELEPVKLKLMLPGLVIHVSTPYWNRTSLHEL